MQRRGFAAGDGRRESRARHPAPATQSFARARARRVTTLEHERQPLDARLHPFRDARRRQRTDIRGDGGARQALEPRFAKRLGHARRTETARAEHRDQHLQLARGPGGAANRA